MIAILIPLIEKKKMMETNWGNLTILKLYKKILINYQR